MWRKVYILLIFLAVSCAPTMNVLVDGFPVSSNEEYLRVPDPEVDLRVQYYAAGWVKKDLGGEEPEPYPIYFKVNEKETLPENVQAVTLNIWIKNPRNITYKVQSWIEVKKPYKGRTREVKNVGGPTSKLNNFITITGPVDPGSSVKLWATIHDSKGFPLVAVGDVYYRVKKEEKHQDFTR